MRALDRHLKVASTPDRISGAMLLPTRRRGFNLIELVVVIAFVSLLTGIMLPSLGTAKETAHRIICASHLRHIGFGLQAYATDFSERLPSSKHLTGETYRPREMMAASAGANALGHVEWDGLGRLVDPRHSYLDTAEVLHCPSHDGLHDYDRYADAYRTRDFAGEIYTNYHYRGAFDRETRRYHQTSGPRRVLVVDGMMTAEDFNHGHGTNRLHSDVSVDWMSDTTYTIVKSIKTVDSLDGTAEQGLYDLIWSRLDPTP